MKRIIPYGRIRLAAYENEGISEFRMREVVQLVEKH
jgi:hypothetical protein